MAWLFGQVFLLCALSFLLGSLVTWLFVTRQRRIETGRAVRTVPVGEVAEAARPQAIEPERGDGAAKAGGAVKGFVEPSGGPGPEVLPGSVLPTEARSAAPKVKDTKFGDTKFEDAEFEDSLSVRLTYAAADGEPAWHEPGEERRQPETAGIAGDPRSNGQEKNGAAGDGQNGAGHNGNGAQESKAVQPLAAAQVPAQTRGPVDEEPEPARSARPEPSEEEQQVSPRMVVPGPYRNSARPSPDGTAPAPDYRVKGNQKSKLYHTSDSPYFTRTKATVWFQTETDAEQAGFTSSAVRRSTSVR
ncbi:MULTISPECIES: hypothetical protein [Actinoalloteichus]|uniref:Membrane protein ArfC n=1 Tax=Actinoalloteichus fjordicus TaxID=1612552 RepID=A0AAC9LH88_9PSEU|nr:MULTISPECIES: hypothetical protein [Actinoalloteichus]APU17656.1 hypothetical protein UA74_28275 [Actinoalloteichus fjordicus]APU23732.1 hypothetical protein UA75_28805 [Actinoalloteichus sp. GBA129-24]